jgi:uncharacterized protein YegP (UPF0339 family)
MNCKCILLIFTFIFTYKISAQTHQPKDEQLFMIERSKDNDKIVYELNLKSVGKLDTIEPIKIYWVKPDNKVQKKPLSWIQNKYAYGLTYEVKKANFCQFRFVAYSDRKLILKKNNKGKFHVYTEYNNKESIVHKIILHITGGTFWTPFIEKLEIHSHYPNSDKANIEIVIP